MKSRYLDDAVCHYISKGTGIERSKVVPGFDNGISPTGIHASVEAYADRSISGNNATEYIQEGKFGLVEVGTRRRSYSVDIYRAGALDAAMQFDIWRQSWEGLVWAESMPSDGIISEVVVRETGEGIVQHDIDAPDVILQSPKSAEVDSEYSPARGRCIVENGKVVGVKLVDYGAGFVYDLPSTENGGITFHFKKMTDRPVIFSRGRGFAIAEIGILRNLSPYFSGEYEERANFDLVVDYGWQIDRPVKKAIAPLNLGG